MGNLVSSPPREKNVVACALSLSISLSPSLARSLFFSLSLSPSLSLSFSRLAFTSCAELVRAELLEVHATTAIRILSVLDLGSRNLKQAVNEPCKDYYGTAPRGLVSSVEATLNDKPGREPDELISTIPTLFTLNPGNPAPSKAHSVAIPAPKHQKTSRSAPSERRDT